MYGRCAPCVIQCLYRMANGLDHSLLSRPVSSRLRKCLVSFTSKPLTRPRDDDDGMPRPNSSSLTIRAGPFFFFSGFIFSSFFFFYFRYITTLMMMTLNRAIFIYLFIIRIRILDGGGGVNFLRFRDRNESAGRCHSCHIQRIFKSFSDLI